MRRWRVTHLCLGVMGGLLTAALAQAGVVYDSNGFEPNTFVLGSLSSQDGWTATGSATVENFLVQSGSQAVAILSDTSGYEALRVSPDAAPIVVLSVGVNLLLNPTAASTWGLVGLNPSGNPLGGILILPDGTLQMVSPGGGTTTPLITRGAWNTVQLLLDFGTSSFDVFLNGTAVQTGVPFANTGTFLTGAVASTGGGGDLLFLDNYAVTDVPAVPEPSTLALLIVGATAFTVRFRSLKQL